MFLKKLNKTVQNKVRDLSHPPPPPATPSQSNPALTSSEDKHAQTLNG